MTGALAISLKNNLLRPDFKGQVKNTLLLKQMITTFSALKTKQMNHGSPLAQIKLNDKSLKIRRMKSFNKKLHLYLQYGGMNVVTNRDITQSFGFHIRWA